MATKDSTAFPKPVGEVKDAPSFRIAIVKAEWNSSITNAMETAALEELQKAGVPLQGILRSTVPGSFELTSGAQMMLEDTRAEAVICLGCVIQGETRHFDFICQAVAGGLTELGIKYKKTVIFGVLTTNDLEQALSRAGGKLGNKGTEAAAAALKMVSLQRSFFQTKRDIVGFNRSNSIEQASKED